MNIFFVFNDEVVTPSTAGTILKGITRDSTLEIIKGRGMKCSEREISIDEVLDRYNNGELVEVFGTGTAALIANVDEIMFDVSKLTFTPDKWSLSTSIRDEINNIRYGTVKDTRGWTVPVKDAVGVTV